MSRDVNHVGLRSPGALCFCDRASVKVVRNAVRRLNAVQAALSSGAGRAFVRSCARLLGLGHAVAHGVIFHSGRRRRTAPAKGMCAFVRTLSCHEKRKDKIVFKCFNAAGYMFVTGGLALCGVNAVPRKGTEAFKGNNLPPPRSNCDISTSLPSCDTLSLQSVPLSVPNNTLQPCRAQQLFFKLLLITT